VYIEEIKAGKPTPSEPVKLTNLKCSFVPHVAVGFKGNQFIERNDDPIPHNIHTYWSGKTMYNIDLLTATLNGPGDDVLFDTGIIPFHVVDSLKRHS